MTLAKNTPLANITIDEAMQGRAGGLDMGIVSEYAQAMLEGDEFPPVKVIWDGETNWLYDGFHTLMATQEAGYDTIDVDVRSGTKRDAWKLSLGVNSAHGRNRTNEDKREVVRRALADEELSALSDREIARLCRVSNPFVSAMRKKEDGVNVNAATPRDQSVKEPSDAKVAKQDALPPVNVNSAFTGPDGEEYADEASFLRAQNEVLQAELEKKADVGAVDALPEEERQTAAETIESLRARVKALETELAAVKASRDTYMRQATEAIKQVKTTQRRLEREGAPAKKAVKPISKAAPAGRK